MLKGVKKGIKKKIKGKKDKKEDDLFDPEQLEKYKRELEEAKKARQQQDEESGSAAAGPSGGHEDDEEWQRFKMLTSGVDCLVNKVSDDLERIKESSFFQRNQVSEQNRLFASEKPSNYKEPEPEPEPEPDLLVDDEEDQKVPEGAEGGGDETPKAPDSPEPVELDDSLFDTTFVEAIATGEIKLAYIPDSPTHEDEDDPFDTSAVADVVKRIEEEEKKAKRQVNLGDAVEFLTGKGGEKTGIARPRTRPGEMKAKARPRPHAVNLLGDFDEGSVPTAPLPDKKDAGKAEKPTDLFDQILDTPMKDTASPLLEKVDLLAAKPVESTGKEEENEDKGIKDVISEFDVISQLDPISGSGEAEPLPAGVPSSIPSSIAALLTTSTAPPDPEEDEWDEEFAALAAESIKKAPPPPEEEEAPEEEDEDPFDTSFVEKTGHGKCELKILENEILGEVKSSEDPAKPAGGGDDDDFDFDPRAGESPPKSLEIQNAPKVNPLEDLTPTAVKAPTIEPHVKAGGPTLVDTEGEVQAKPEEDIDPFDTSKLETVLPGKAELKLLEMELLSSVEQPKVEQPKLPDKIVAMIKSQQTEDEEFDFDPRKGEVKQHVLDLHDVSHQAFDTISKVLTPQQESEVEVDPFDTSAVAASGLIPTELELKLLESELVTPTTDPAPQIVTTAPQPKITRTTSDDDFDFDPRAGQPAPTLAPKPPPTTEELFDSTMDFAVDKPLTPQLEMPSQVVPEPKLCPANVEDPFDTSGIQIENYLAKSELRQVEEELLNAPSQPLPVRTLPVVVAVEFKKPPPQPVIPEPQPPPPTHILEAMTPIDDTIKPLTPQEAPTAGVISVFNPTPSAYIDPFDTSIAEAVIPNSKEMGKLLEEELGVCGGRRLSDPDFDPREPSHPGQMASAQPLTPMPMQPVVKPVEVDPFDTSAVTTESRCPFSSTNPFHNNNFDNIYYPCPYRSKYF